MVSLIEVRGKVVIGITRLGQELKVFETFVEQLEVWWGVSACNLTRKIL